uniref:Uncharacterized protein n=1 Tax=Craspedostauros australis TaxID=1486917 RepID=A0A7R9ZP18_9STRA|mmetsp:Transcript_3420/g.9056  ORF Transcript_3420/g.9056 Transcript_3420/m.9056 type:complete len:117 (+) Transcript_3420:104-454(+)
MFIKATYTIANDTGEPQTHQFQLDASNVEIQPVGLPDNTPATKPQAGEYKYSGVHDHGDLIPPIEDANDMKALISCMGTFKKESDQLLTKLIEDEKLKKTTASAEENPMKRPRVDQ